MPFFTTRRCYDCGGDWEDIHDTMWVTVGQVDLMQEQTYALHTCPKCHFHVYLQREADGNSWRNWMQSLPKSPEGPRERFAAEVAERIQKLMSASGSLYRPTAIHLTSLDCPICHIPLIPGAIEPPPSVCPHCGSTHSTDIGGGHVIFA